MKTHIIYLTICILLIGALVYFVHDWDSKGKQIEALQAQIKVNQTLGQIDAQVTDIQKRDADNQKLDQASTKVNKKLDTLYKAEKLIPKPNLGAIENAVENADINTINNAFHRMGYNSSIINR